MLKHNIKNVLLMLLIAAILGSCNKDDASSSQVTLFSFGPTGVKHGDQIKFIGQNLDKVTSIILPPNVEIPASSFVSKTGVLIELVVPEAAEAGKIILKTPQGDIESKSMLSFLVPVTITSVTAEAKPGTNISIKGTFVNWIESVTFNNGVKVTEFVSKSLEEVVVTVPLEAKTGFLIFATGGTKPLTFASENQLIVTLPTVSSFSPAAIEQTKNITFTGTNLDLISEVQFKEGSAGSAKVGTFESQTETELVVAVPNTAVSGVITLMVPSGVTLVTSQTLTVTEPSITNLTVARNGADIVITGNVLNLVGSLIFPNGGAGKTVASADFKSVASDGTSITVTVPADAIPGIMKIVTIYDFNINVPGFDITQPVASAYSSSTPGSVLKITGTDLDLVASIIFPDDATGISVVAANFTSVTSSEIKLTIPAGVKPGYLQFKMANGFTIVEKPQFGNVSGPDPVIDAALVFFDFNGAGKDSWWGKGGVVSTAPSADNTGYWAINSSLKDWSDLFWRNGGNNFPGGSVGTLVDDYVVKIDINVLTAVTDGNIKIRLQDSDSGEGDFWYCIGPAAPSGMGTGNLEVTGGWKTITIPISKFKDNYGWGSTVITDMSKIDVFGMAFDNGTATLNIAIDNLRFEKIN